MPDPLTKDQLRRIEATLARIRGGLAKAAPAAFEEPAHVFKPEAYRAAD